MSFDATAPSEERSALIARARRAWIEGEGPAGARVEEPWLARSWQRCLAAGYRPQQRVVFDAVSAQAMRRTTERSARLLQAARPVLDRLTRAIVDTRYFAILTDADGIVIDIGTQPDRADRHATAIARIGIDLSERAVGTTAIGAALAERASVWLHRGEHFFDDTSVYTCAGAPLFDPLGGCIGMLDLTGVNVAERPALRHLAQRSAHAIGNALGARAAGRTAAAVQLAGLPGRRRRRRRRPALRRRRRPGHRRQRGGAPAAAVAGCGRRHADAVHRPVRGADVHAVRCRAASSGPDRGATVVRAAPAPAGIARRGARRAMCRQPARHGCATWRRPGSAGRSMTRAATWPRRRAHWASAAPRYTAGWRAAASDERGLFAGRAAACRGSTRSRASRWSSSARRGAVSASGRSPCWHRRWPASRRCAISRSRTAAARRWAVRSASSCGRR